MSGGLLGIAQSALMTHQTALQTISQNIANAQTPGYSRQEAILSATTPVRMSYGNVGTGVTVNTIIRKRDILLDDNYRTASGLAGESELRRDSLSSIQDVFGEPSDAGMASTLDQFWSAWSDLATTPSSQAARAVVQQRGSQLASLFNGYDTSLTQQRMSTLDRLTNTVTQINGIASSVAELNGRIVSSEAGGDMAADLRDQRDMMLDQLSTLAGTRVIPQKDGSVSVIIGNSTLVDGISARPVKLALAPTQPPPAVPSPDVPVILQLGTSTDPLRPLGGQLLSMSQTLNTDIPALRGRLDALAGALVTAVNAVHTTGYLFSGNTLPGTAAGNFFDAGSPASPVSAATIRLDDDIIADSANIAAGTDANAPLDNAMATALSALRNSTNAVTYTSGSTTETGGFLSFFRTTVTRLGLDVRQATDDATVYRTLTDQGEARRQSVSGVNTDEELVNMMRVQQSYTAATKLIKVADEMLQTILSLV